jgi:hypothetical protein
VKVIEGGATTRILEQVIIALSIHGQDNKGYSHTCLGRLTTCAVQMGLVQKTGHSSSVLQ